METKIKGCGKELGYKGSENGEIRLCGDEVFRGTKTGLGIVYCDKCKTNKMKIIRNLKINKVNRIITDLNEAFIWKSTKQGLKYWEKVTDNLIEMKESREKLKVNKSK